MLYIHRLLKFIVLFLMITTWTYAGTLQVQIKNNRLLLQAQDSFLQDILHEIERQGVKISVDPKFNPKISVSFRNRDLQKGLDSLLKPFSYILIWKASATPPGSELAEIRIFNRGTPTEQSRSPNLAVVRNPEDGSFYIKNTIMVRLKPGADVAQFRSRLNKIGGRIVSFHTGSGIYEIRLPENSDTLNWVKRFADFPDVSHAEPNYAFHSPILYRYTGFDNAPIRLAETDIPEDAAPIAIMDSGLNMDHNLENVVLTSLDALNPNQPITDTVGHGTRMALIASGLIDPVGDSTEEDPPNPVIPIKLFDENGWSSNSHIIRGIDFALKNGARVLSLSWKTQNPSPFLQDALDYAHSKGAIIIAAAGNEPTGEPVYPAAYPSVTGVGALDPDGLSWQKSNYGAFVDVQAPGFAIFPTEQGQAEMRAGTSISTAYIANQIASYLRRHPGASNEEALEAVKQNTAN
ncbi:S8 family serine peptidase [Desulfococcaceae bacterium HSG9]|nr:S8 family serine peptidase [Desulfococcaceae bacterium HSG9]